MRWWERRTKRTSTHNTKRTLQNNTNYQYYQPAIQYNIKPHNTTPLHTKLDKTAMYTDSLETMHTDRSIYCTSQRGAHHIAHTLWHKAATCNVQGVTVTCNVGDDGGGPLHTL